MSRGAADSVQIVTHRTGPREVIVMGIPSFGTVSIWWAARWYNLRMPMNRIVRHVYVVGKEVGLARNEIVARALQLEQDDPSMRCSHVFFLDDDCLVHPDALVKLLSHRRPIVSGLYYAKTSVPTPLVLAGEYDGTPQTWMPGDLVECWAHGMGCTLIEADVFRQMQPSVGQDSAGYPAWFATTRDAGVVSASGVPGTFNQTEDVAFLRRAAALGHTPAVDTSAQTFCFHWDAGKQTAYPQKQWKEFCETGRMTWDVNGGAVTWETAA